MNENIGIIGRKLGMTQIFTEEGDRVACTAVQVGPNVVIAIKTMERDGYSALQLGFEDKAARLVNKAERGRFAKAEVTPKRVLREVRVTAEEAAEYKVGQALGAEMFTEGDRVDVAGTTRGRGFQGVMRRHSFTGFPMTHGTHEYRRHPGAIGSRSYPGKVFKGHRMGGQMGNTRVTVHNQRIAKILAEEQIVYVRGALPGPTGRVVVLRRTVKASTGALAG